MTADRGSSEEQGAAVQNSRCKRAKEKWLCKESGGKERETAYAGAVLALSLTEAETRGVHGGTRRDKRVTGK